MHVFHRAIRHDEPNIGGTDRLTGKGALYRALGKSDVVRVDAFQRSGELRLGRWIKSENARTLGGPEQLTRRDVDADSSGSGHLLCFRQQRLAVAESILGTFSLFNVGH